MCGFFCIIGENQNKLISENETILAGQKYLHRGPDSQKFYFENEFRCYFRRLSIIDLNQRSDQPFHSKNKRYLILFNGEIYNFKILKKELKNLGCKFYTEGDTEVLLKAFEIWGKKFIKKIQGMFSICIWDKKFKKFYAFRDRFGIKPLYYVYLKNTYIFSSEIKDILSLIKIKKIDENHNVISNYLANSFLNDTDQTFFKNIKSVNPGNMIEIKNKKMTIQKYWSLKYSETKNLDQKEIINNFNKTLKMHTISDVPIAYTLSGGIDSSLLTGASVKMKEFNAKTKFFSIIPKNTLDESHWIDTTVKKFNLNHYYCNSGKTNFDDYKNFINFQDEPVQTSSAYYQYLLRKKIKKYGLKVLMVGEGADEVYGGYKRCLFYYLNHMNFNKKRTTEFLLKSNKFMQNDVNEILSNYLEFNNRIKTNVSDIEDFSSEKFLKKKVLNKFLSIPQNSKNFFKDALISHMTKRDLPYVLRMEDRNSMSQSIEARVPFLDHKMVEYVFNIKTKFFMQNAENKHILRSCFKNYFSKEVISRKEKSPRPGDNSDFIFNTFYGYFLDLLNNNLQNNYFNNKKIKVCLESDKKKKFYQNSSFYFRVFNYLVWRENFNNHS